MAWLEKSANVIDGQWRGWSYQGTGGNRSDRSNTRYGLNGLFAAHQAGFKAKDKDLWNKVRQMTLRDQNKDGGWCYVDKAGRSTQTMTLAGLIALHQANTIIGKADEAVYKDMGRGYAWLAKDFRLKNPPHTFYNLDSIAQLGRVSKRANFGTDEKPIDWRAGGGKWLLEQQKAGGYWQLSDALDAFPSVSTAFALRFLATKP